MAVANEVAEYLTSGGVADYRLRLPVATVYRLRQLALAEEVRRKKPVDWKELLVAGAEEFLKNNKGEIGAN